MSLENFPVRIAKMNDTFKLPSNTKLTGLGVERIRQFKTLIEKEAAELDTVRYTADGPDFVELADVMADIVVYTFSEARRWGIPLAQVLELVMDSQDSKLGPDGQPIMSADGAKFEKGPNYVAPEPLIAELLELYK
jgi:predicted HAD superfamily Cof-like phosphohydrolase